MYDNFVYGQELSTAVGFVSVLFPFIKIGDPVGDTFSWEAADGSGTLGSDWTYVPHILKDGVYIITMQWWDEGELGGGGNNAELRYNLNLVGGRYPGQVASSTPLKQYFYRDYNGYSTNYDWKTATWTVPLQLTSTYCSVGLTVALLRESAAADFTDLVAHSMWIARIGDLGTTDSVLANDDPGPP